MENKKIIDYFGRFKKAVIYDAPVKIGDKYWFPYIDAIYSYDVANGKIKKEQDLKIQNGYRQPFGFIANSERKMILAPFEDNKILIYDTEIQSQHMEVLEFGKEDVSAYYRHVVIFGEKIFMLPGSVDNDILVIDNFSSIRKIKIDDWEGKIRGTERTSEYAIQDKYLWVTAHYSGQVLKLDMTTEQYELIEVEKDMVGYTGIVFDGEFIWLAESSTGAFVRYNIENGNTKIFDAPAELDYNSTEKNYVHLSLFHFGKYIVSTPALCGEMTILDKELEKLDIFDIGFFDIIMETKSNYKYGNYSASSFGKKINENTLWVQRALDGEIACINMDDLTYTTFSFKFDKEEFYRIGAWRYRSGITINEEDWMTSLKSFIYLLGDAKESIVEEFASNIGAGIWRKVK